MNKCIASFLGPCDRPSKEDYISKSILDLIGDGPSMLVGGYTWCPPDQNILIGKSSIRAGILCRKHNSELSLLDTEAKKIFLFFTNIEDCERGKKDYGSIEKNVEIKGALFERWMLKYIAGVMASGGAYASRFNANENFINENLINILFGKNNWPENSGLHLNSNKILRMAKKEIKADFFASLENNEFFDKDRLVAVEMKFHGFPFVLSFFELPNTPKELKENDLKNHWQYRPTKISFVRHWKLYEVNFIWPEDYNVGREVSLTDIS